MTHPTGSLKHRLARSLFLYGICNGRIRHDTPIVEASSGSTAISEVYFARMLGLPFHAVMSASTSQEKVHEIERQHGQCHLVADGKGIYAAAEDLAASWAASTWTSSPTPSAPPTGAATTTSPN